MVVFDNTSKIYRGAAREIVALNKVFLKISAGEFVVVRGPSGSGKTTLLLSAGGMLRPTIGNIFVDGSNLYTLDHRGRSKIRFEKIGFVFQLFHLIPYLNVLENILIGAVADRPNTRREQATELADTLGISERLSHRPGELSAGEKQRVALARAFLKNPAILMADEPTGNLDPENSEVVFNALENYHRHGGTVLLVTHGTEADKMADKIVHLRNGRIESGTN